MKSCKFLIPSFHRSIIPSFILHDLTQPLIPSHPALFFHLSLSLKSYLLPPASSPNGSRPTHTSAVKPQRASPSISKLRVRLATADSSPTKASYLESTPTKLSRCPSAAYSPIFHTEADIHARPTTDKGAFGD